MNEPPVSAARRRRSSGSALERTGWPLASRLVAARAPGRVDLGHRGAARTKRSREHGVHRDAFGLRARDGGVDTALEVLAVGEDDGVPAARRPGGEQIGGRSDARGERRAGPGAHAGLDRVEEESDGRRVESERHERLGVSFAGDRARRGRFRGATGETARLAARERSAKVRRPPRASRRRCRGRRRRRPRGAPPSRSSCPSGAARTRRQARARRGARA